MALSFRLSRYRRYSDGNETVEAATSIVIRQQDGDYPRCDRGVRRILRTIVTGQNVIIDLHTHFAFTGADRGEVMPGTDGGDVSVAQCFEHHVVHECHMGCGVRSESSEEIE